MRSSRNTKDIPWQHALALALVALLLQFANVILFEGKIQLLVSIAIGAGLLATLRTLMVREKRLYPHGRP